MSGIASPLRLKQGASLALDMRITDDLNSPVNLSAATVTAVVADPFGDQVATPTVTPAAEAGWFTISASTAGWPIGTLPVQITVAQGGVTEISEAFSITIEAPVA